MIYEHKVLRFLYDRSPVVLQDLMVSGYGLYRRLEQQGPQQGGFRQGLARLERLNPDQVVEAQEAAMRDLISHAYDSVPFYHRRLDELGLKPKDFQRLNDLFRLPVLTKNDVRDHFPELTATNTDPRSVTIGRTGGTTGVPLKFYLDHTQVAMDHAITMRQWEWAGYRPGDRVVFLRGFTLVAPGHESRVFWRRDWFNNWFYLSGFHLSPATQPLYVRKLHEWQPKYIAAYPSLLFEVARRLAQTEDYIPLRGVFTSSELLTPAERALIEERFKCRVFDRYGTGERLVVAHQCEHGTYHLNPGFGILQVQRSDGQPAAPGEVGDFILSGLSNRSMPLIRYAIGDRGALRSESGCPCGRNLPALEVVEGRKDDSLITAEGRVMPRAGLDQVYEFSPNIEQCQLYQRVPGQVVVRVVRRPGYTDEDSHRLLSELRKRVGEGTEITIEFRDSIPLAASGKYRFIVSEVGSSPGAIEPS